MSAPPNVAPLSPYGTEPNATPTARPSGILCSVIENTNNAQRFLLPKRSFPLRLSKNAKTLSPIKSNRPPPKKPDNAVIQAFIFKFCAISIDGDKSDQND